MTKLKEKMASLRLRATQALEAAQAAGAASQSRRDIEAQIAARAQQHYDETAARLEERLREQEAARQPPAQTITAPSCEPSDGGGPGGAGEGFDDEHPRHRICHRVVSPPKTCWLDIQNTADELRPTRCVRRRGCE